MANSVYQNHKNINQSIEFRGLKAQYIWYLGGGVVVLLILFAGMFILGIPSLVCVGLTFIGGGFLVMKIYRMSKTFGEHGLMKRLAQRQITRVITSRDRGAFYRPICENKARTTPLKAHLLKQRRLDKEFRKSMQEENNPTGKRRKGKGRSL